LGFIICLEDGKKFISLKRHIDVHFGLTPDVNRDGVLMPTGIV
jgi:predicted transcriptional regulator